MTVLIDSSAWFDYFFGQKNGAKVREVVKSGEEVLLSQVNVVEIYSKYLKHCPSEAEEKKNFILSRCRVVQVTKEIGVEAAKQKIKHELAMADSIIFATALMSKARLLTSDKDFRGLENVEVL